MDADEVVNEEAMKEDEIEDSDGATTESDSDSDSDDDEEYLPDDGE